MCPCNPVYISSRRAAPDRYQPEYCHHSAERGWLGYVYQTMSAMKQISPVYISSRRAALDRYQPEYCHRSAERGWLGYVYQTMSAQEMKQVRIKSNIFTVKPVLSGHLKRTQKLVFIYNYCLMLVKSIAECSKGSILQYIRPSLSYHFPLFCLFYSGRLRQVLLYMDPDKDF